jgi:hypothetical protein
MLTEKLKAHVDYVKSTKKKQMVIPSGFRMLAKNECKIGHDIVCTHLRY